MIHVRKFKLGIWIALIGGAAEPLSGFQRVFRNASSSFVHETQTPLGLGIVLQSRSPIPFHRLGIVLGHAIAVDIQAS
jgi:hypothetical protein